MYKTSKDYNKLYDLICEGKEVICYVGFTTDSKYRSICKCIIDYDYIGFISRGYNYADVEKDDKELFIEECVSLNVEWIAETTDEHLYDILKETSEAITFPGEDIVIKHDLYNRIEKTLKDYEKRN